MEANPFDLPQSGGPKGSDRHLSWKTPLVFGWVIFLVLLCIFVIWQKVANDNARISTQASEQVDASEVALPDLGAADDALAASAKNRTLEVNGQLKVNNSLIFNPSDPPENPVVGQVYYDKTSNTPIYYNGTQFVAVASKQDIQANNAPVLQSTSLASVVLGQPLNVASGSVLIGGDSGAIASVTAGFAGLCLLSTAGSPSFQPCPSGSATPNTVTSTTNTSGSIAKIGASNTIVDSLLSDNGTAISVNGVLNLGANNLQLGNSGFGMTLNTTTLSANRSILLPNESGTVCLQDSGSCGFITGTPANFIQSQNVGPQAGSNYWIAGVGRADGGLIGPSFDTASSGVLSIGGNASSISINDDTTINGALQIALNSSSVNSPILQLEQGGGGDSTIELKNSSGGSFYVGMDQSAGGVLRIGSSTAARTTNSIGTTVAGGIAFQGVDSQIIAKKVVTGPADSGTLSSIATYLSSVDGVASGVKVGLYSHDGTNNRPNALIAASTVSVPGSVGWNALPLSAAVSSNTTYWIAVNVEGSGTGVGYDYCGGCATDSATYYPRPFAQSWPVSLGAPNNVLDSQEWSFYMNVASGAVNDTFAGAKLLSMTDTGSLTLQNSANTNTAFQIQNAAGSSLMNVNTVSGEVTVEDQLVADRLTVGGNLYTTNIDIAGPGTLNIAGTNATTVDIANSAAGHTVNIATGFGSQIVNIGSASNSSGLYLQGGSNNIVFNSSSDIRAQYDGVYTFGNRAGGYHMIINSATNQIVTQYGTEVVVQGGLTVENPAVFNSGIIINNGTLPSYTTPMGTLLQTAVNIPNYTVGAFGTILALGLDSTSPSTARGLLMADARNVAHQPTIGVLSPNENDIVGLSWDGDNATARLKTLGANVSIQLNTNEVAHFTGSQIYLNQSTQVTGALQVNGTSSITGNSTTAFVVQNTSNVELLRADTNLMKLTVRELEVTYNLTVGGDVSFGRHLRSGGSSPTTVTGPAACTSPTVTVSGTDTAGMVTVVAGTGCSSNGAVMAVIFANAFGAAPKVTLTPATSSASTLPAYVDYTQVTTTSFDITTNAPLVDGATYRWYYHAIE